MQIIYSECAIEVQPGGLIETQADIAHHTEGRSRLVTKVAVAPRGRPVGWAKRGAPPSAGVSLGTLCP
jgi:hypothetical protein